MRFPRLDEVFVRPTNATDQWRQSVWNIHALKKMIDVNCKDNVDVGDQVYVVR